MTERPPARANFPRAIVPLAALIIAALPLAGCIVPLIAGTAAGGYTLATEHRSPEQLARDAAIGAAAHKYWADASSDLARDLTATVYDGELLITGLVPNQAMKDRAEQLARQIDGVKKIDNMVQVGPPTNFGQDARDNYASNALRAQLLADPQVRSSNFTVHTENGIVYILGYARNAPERDLVLSYARNLSNVDRVVSLIEVGNEPALAPRAAPAASPGNAPPPEEAPPAPPPPRSNIEVQPLQ
ncbi:MAG TPA: BON domain-containing protein [Stellaceae bacterium]